MSFTNPVILVFTTYQIYSKIIQYQLLILRENGANMIQNELSKHAVLSQWIKENIANETFKVGAKIPSENDYTWY